ncbi:MAG: dihydrodipicolinate synthase family protein, partial [Solirubrobacteraceae bacterium]
MKLEGIMTALTTPFDADDRVDHPALRANLRRQLDAGVGAIVALGTMGEHGSLADSEREQVLATIIDECGAACPVIAGVSAERTSVAREHAQRAAAAGAAGVMCLPPLLYDAEPHELAAHYSAVAEAGLPIMLYNNPGASHSDLRPQTILALAHQVESIASVKECSGDARRIAELLEIAGDRLEVYVGGDDWALEGLCAGAGGW